MTIQQLTEIVKLTNKRAIMAKLKQLGYIDCAKDKKLRHINLCDIANRNTISTDVFLAKNGKHEYYGDICTNVKGYENLEFVIVSVNKVYKKKNLSFPCKMFAFAKEIKL